MKDCTKLSSAAGVFRAEKSLSVTELVVLLDVRSAGLTHRTKERRGAAHCLRPHTSPPAAAAGDASFSTLPPVSLVATARH